MKIIVVIAVLLQVLFTLAQPPPSAHGTRSTRKYVTVHNALRRQLSKGLVPNQPKATNLFDLKYDKKLEKEAAKISATCDFDHARVKDRRFDVGQNLFKSSNRSWDEAIQTWFDEHKVYRYPGGFAYETAHYTQVVWADTKYVGCAYSKCEDEDDYFYVCNYGPSGNYEGQKPYETK